MKKASVYLALVLLSVGGVAWGQETTDITPPPPPPPPPAPAVSPGAPATDTSPKVADRAATPQRFSRFSAGRGGPLFVFSEVIAGLVGGGMLGASLGAASGGSGASGGAYMGLLVGGLVLGGVGMGVQYFHPIGFASAGAIALATGVGGLFGAGLGVALGSRGADPRVVAGLLLAGTQAGALAALIGTWGVDDINGEDLALMGMTSLYGFVVTGLIMLSLAPTVGAIPSWPLLMAPALGMGLGAVWAMFTDMSPGRVLKLTALPCGVGLILFYGGILLAISGSPALWGITTLTGVVVTFALTYLLTMPSPEEEAAAAARKKITQAPQVMPTLAFMPAGRRNEGLAVGPALVGRF